MARETKQHVGKRNAENETIVDPQDFFSTADRNGSHLGVLLEETLSAEDVEEKLTKDLEYLAKILERLGRMGWTQTDPRTKGKNFWADTVCTIAKVLGEETAKDFAIFHLSELDKVIAGDKGYEDVLVDVERREQARKRWDKLRDKLELHVDEALNWWTYWRGTSLLIIQRITLRKRGKRWSWFIKIHGDSAVISNFLRWSRSLMKYVVIDTCIYKLEQEFGTVLYNYLWSYTHFAM